MIGTLLRMAWITLSRDRVVQLLIFVLPISFFSIFAGVFAGQGRSATGRLRVAVVDEDGSEASHRVVQALQKEGSLRVRTSARPAGAPQDAAEVPLDRARAEALVRNGDLPVAVILPEGFGAAFMSFDSTRQEIELLADSSDPIAPQIVNGLLQKVVMTGTPDLFVGSGIGQFEKYAGGLTPQQRKAVDQWLPWLKQRGQGGGGRFPGDTAATDSSAKAASDTSAPGLGGLLPVRMVDVLGETKKNPVVAFYAAGIAVMFLLFSSSGAGGSLLDEVDTGTLERILGTRLGMTGLLFGKWLFVALIGILQVTVMFTWGALVFGLDLLGHLPGFAVMTVFTAAAAAGFGMVLATACRSRQQLSGISTLVILTMSALGGSMFPRFFMSDAMQKAGLFTFNAWALDGYTKVFWREAPLVELWPQLAVLGALTVVFLVAARTLARRWETV